MALQAEARGSSEEPTVDPEGCYCIDRVGNVNCDYRDLVTIGDLGLLIDHLFINHPRLPNAEEANINGDPGGVIDIADVSLLIDHLFVTFPELPLCPQPPNAPPVTTLSGLIPGYYYVNSTGPEVAVGGIPVRWAAYDRVDHPYFPPPFEFEYRVYGPYSDSLLGVLLDSYMVTVFRMRDGTIMRFGEPPDTVGYDTFWTEGVIDSIVPRLMFSHYIACDTSWDGGVREIECDTVFIDNLDGANDFGWIDTLFDIDDPGFANDPVLNRIALQSSDGADSWTYRLSDTLYDLYHDFPAETTKLQNFIVWVCSRDPVDTALHDPTPAFGTAIALDGAFERDVFLIYMSASAADNKGNTDSAQSFWTATIADWIDSRAPSLNLQFDASVDFVRTPTGYIDGFAMLQQALSHKVVIILQDAATTGGWSESDDFLDCVLTAMSVGTNVWAATRVPTGGHASLSSPATVDVLDETYRYFFGVERYTFPGWGAGLRNANDGFGYGLPRIEDFVGAISDNPAAWPDLEVDTLHLHNRYLWAGSLDPLAPPFYPWNPDLGALPQVGWMEVSDDAEVMYRYVSLYGDAPMSYPWHNFSGRPVMCRLDRGAFRSVHSLFTPLSLDAADARHLVDSVLNYLIEPYFTLKSDRFRFETVEPRELYFERLDEAAGSDLPGEGETR